MKNNIFHALADIVLPPECHICGEALLSGEKFICQPCFRALPRTHYHRRPDNPVEMRFAGLFPFDRATSLFFYGADSRIASLIHDFKYRGFPSLGRHLGFLAGQELLYAGWLNDIDFVCPVPLHWWKRMIRGYNQSEEIAKGIAEACGIDLTLELAARRHHRTQTSMSEEQRRQNTRGIFRLRHPGRYAGKTILLVDDVCTTGATLTSAAEAILRAQPEARLVILTLATT